MITTTYGAQGLPAGLDSSLGETLVAGAEYNALGQMTGLNLGSSLQTAYGYYAPDAPNGRSRLESIYSQRLSDGLVLQNLSYVYDAVGNVLSLSDAGSTTSFAYDALDRLTGASGAYSASYSYDEVGNLLTKEEGGLNHTLWYTDTAHVHAVSRVDAEPYVYDANGNLLSGGGRSMEWDTENRPVAVTASGETVTFGYDGDGARVTRDTVTDTVVYVGSHFEVRLERQDTPEDVDDNCVVTVADIQQVAAHWGETAGPDDPWNLDGDTDVDVYDIMTVADAWRETCHVPVETVKYYSLGGRRVAMRKVPAGQQQGTLYYLLTDHLGSTSVMYDTSSGTWVTQRYAPYGRVRPSGANALPTDYTFTGQRVDEAIGLMDYGARWYDPTIGRFISPDPIVPEPGNPQALNRYSYVLANPLRYADPSGYFSEEQIKGFLGLDPDAPWQEVLAFFEEGGQLQGRWGWLDVLRAAEVGDEVRFLDATGREVFSGQFFIRENQLFLGRDDFSLPQLEVAQRGDIYEFKHYIEHPKEPNLGEALAGGFVIVVSDVFIGIPGIYLTIVGGGVTPIAHVGEILDLIALGGNIFGLYLIVDSGVISQLAPTVRSVEYVEIVPAFPTESDSRPLAPRLGPVEGGNFLSMRWRR